MAHRAPEQSPFSPLAYPAFRILWAVWLAAHLCMWMNDVAAAWLMTAISGDPLLVALVQSASTLPVFLLAVPSGALADIIDRRRFLIFTQFWVAVIAILLSLTSALGRLTPISLLLLTFANGFGLAMRWPTFAALTAEVVPRSQLPVATALAGMALNSSRILGPLIAGVLIVGGGANAVFALNATLSVAAGVTLLFWRRQAVPRSLPSESILGAIRVGIQHVRQSTRMRAAIGRTLVFSFSSIGLLALLPLLVTRHLGSGAQTYAVLMAAMGFGAIAGAMLLPRIRRRLGRESFVGVGSFLMALASVGAALAPTAAFAVPSLAVAGAGWIMAANALNIAAHFALQDWARARGIAFFQMAMMGGAAAGAAWWGQYAKMFGVRAGLFAAAVATLLGWLLTRRLALSGDPVAEVSQTPVWNAPELAVPIGFHAGPVQITVEYRIEPDRAQDFIEVMRESRRVWLQSGARSWQLYRDIEDPSRYFEQFVDQTWGDCLRRQARISTAHVELRQKKLSFHLADVPPVVTRCVAAELPRL